MPDFLLLFLDPVLGALLVVTGLLLGAFRPDLAELDLPARLWKAARVVMVAVGVALLIGLLSVAPRDETPAMEWRPDIERALVEARSRGVPAVVDCGAKWCAACRELEEKTLSDPAVIEALSSRNFVPIRVDMTDFDPSQKRLKDLGLSIQSLPWVGFFLPDGRLNPGSTLTDFEPPRAFVSRIEQSLQYHEAPLSPIEAWISTYGLWVTLALVFAAGVGISLTPCVYPMIPITLSVLGRTAASPGGEGFRPRLARTTVFVAGLVATYSVLGVGSALLGKGFGSWLQHPAVTLGMAALFLTLALSYLGFFRIDLPYALKSRLNTRRSGLAGVALIGAATGVVAAPCAGPVVVGILALIGSSGNVGLGLALMVVFGIGMGVLFFVLGLSTGLLGRLPRGGSWMERVEIAFATTFVVVAIYYAGLGF